MSIRTAHFYVGYAWEHKEPCKPDPYQVFDVSTGKPISIPMTP